VKVSHSRNDEVDGLFTTQCAVGGSDSVKVENVKVMSYYGWGDGFNVFASNNVTYRHIFARTSDDCTTIYATRKGYKGGCRNILTEDAVLWADVAHPFMVGLHGSATEIGVDAPSDVITDIVYRDIDVVDMHEPQVDYQGVFAILASDNNIVKDITFDNIRVENFRRGRLIDIRIAWNRKYCAAPGALIENVLFKDVVYNGDRSDLSLIIGYDDVRKVKGITFDNLVINGEHIYDKMPGKPGWYKTSDMMRMFIGEHVEDVVFK
ncbi:MAG: endo-polygalacturonase, partial [Muribaculaceae bacterium]|nr:endo-polygalacturonase [Muribaculaceae bacterium]